MRHNPNSRFAEYVTSIAFHVSLSRNMCSVLLAIEAEEKRTKGEWWQSETSGYGSFITTARSLENRGLIEYHAPPVDKKTGYPVLGSKVWRLTEEGKLMAQLVRRAGPSISEKRKNVA